jgi:hypothetical protein
MTESTTNPSEDTGMETPPEAPRRDVFEADALEWLAANPAPIGSSVVTSLPDVSEVPQLDFPQWRAWFIATAERIMRWVPEDGVSIFYQSDIRQAGVWLDKGYLVQRAAEAAAAKLLWHKIVCRKPPGTISHGRATYTHVLCFTMGAAIPPRHPGPDVLADAGTMIWSRAMGLEAARLCCRYLREDTATRCIVDPFCGKGSALAMANAFGFDAIGVDKSASRCRAARRLQVQ